MGIKQVVVSDISNEEIGDDEHARIVITDHPKLNNNTPVELDVSVAEAERFQTSTIELVNITVYEPNRAPRRVVLEGSTFAELFKGVDMNALVEAGRQVARESGAGRGRPAGPRRARSASPAKADRIDYLSQERFGQLHRGRVTEEEARLVRENLDQANKNRAAAGQPAIDPANEREKARYGL
jgi:hypothetical protein